MSTHTATQKARAGDYRGAIIDFVLSNGSTTFPELQAFLAPYMEVKGDQLISVKNVVFWAEMSGEFLDALESVWGCPELELVDTSPLVYAFNGGILNLPLAKRVPRDGYRKPHWQPCVLTKRQAA